MDLDIACDRLNLRQGNDTEYQVKIWMDCSTIKVICVKTVTQNTPSQAHKLL